MEKDLKPSISLRTWLVVAACCCVYLVLTFIYFDCFVDDSYISYRYARNFSQGNGLIFNKTGKPVEGYSNFLFVVILAGLHKLGADIPVSSKVIGILSGLAILILLPFFMRRIGLEEKGKSGGLWLATFLLCPLAPFIVWSVAGLETVFYTYLVTLAAYMRLGELNDGKKFPFSGLIFAAVALTRPEGAMFFVVAGIFLLALWKFRGRKPARNDFIWAGLFLLPFLAHLFWRYSYYGYWLSNTYYAKGTGLPLSISLRKGIGYLARFSIIFGPILVFCALLSLIIPIWRKSITVKLLLPVFAGVQSLFILKVGGDWMMSSRFLVPISPLLCVMTALVLLKVGRSMVSGKIIPSPVLIVTFLIVVGGWRMYSTGRAASNDWIPYSRGLYNAHGEIGNWLKKNASPQETIALGDVGIIPYVSDLNTIDLVGLTNEYYAHLPGVLYFGKYDVEWVIKHNPHYIILTSKERLENQELSVIALTPVERGIAGSREFTDKYKCILEKRFNATYWVTLWRQEEVTK